MRAMPPVGSSAVAMVVGDQMSREEAFEGWSSHPVAVMGSNAWREHPGTERVASSADGYNAEARHKAPGVGRGVGWFVE
jgi:hypothetical protein